MRNVKYKIFPWGLRTTDFEKTLKKVEEFISKPGVTDVVSIMNSTFGIILWYKTVRTFKITQKKP